MSSDSDEFGNCCVMYCVLRPLPLRHNTVGLDSDPGPGALFTSTSTYSTAAIGHTAQYHS